MKKCKIFLPISCRSDDPLTKPLIEALEKEEWCEFLTYSLVPACLGNNIQYITDYLVNGLKEEWYPDIALICGDRIEMFACMTAIFHISMWNKPKISIIHYGSGITNTISTFDDINRHSMALMADVCLCEDFQSAYNTNELWETIGKYEKGSSYDKITFKERNIHIVGNLYLEGLDDIDESLVPDEPYDLVLVNKETLGDNMFGMIPQRKTIYIGANPDGRVWNQNTQITYDNLPRPKFLGLMKNASRFITNSSSAFYESTSLGLKKEQIILVGARNSQRSTQMFWNQKYKSSEKIISIIKEWWFNKNEL